MFWKKKTKPARNIEMQDDAPIIRIQLRAKSQQELENYLGLINNWSARYPQLTSRLQIGINSYISMTD